MSITPPSFHVPPNIPVPWPSIFPGTGTSTLVPVPVFAVPAVPWRSFSEQRHRLEEYYFAPRELNIPANFPKFFPANILPCWKSLAWFFAGTPNHIKCHYSWFQSVSRKCIFCAIMYYSEMSASLISQNR